MKLGTQDVMNVALLSVLTTIGAWIHVPLPFSPVPVTLQTLFTYISGALLGGYLGALSQLLYVLMGVAGLPVFAGGGSSVSVLIGPRGGYLLGFTLGAFVIGRLAGMKENPSFRWLLICMTAGTVIIYVLGILQLMNWTGIGLKEAMFTGVLPFIVGDVLKMLVAAYMAVRIKKILRK